MRLRYNGEQTEVRDGILLKDFLQQNGYRLQVIAVERNLKIVPKDAYASTVLQDGDDVEVVSFMGGG